MKQVQSVVVINNNNNSLEMIINETYANIYIFIFCLLKFICLLNGRFKCDIPIWRSFEYGSQMVENGRGWLALNKRDYRLKCFPKLLHSILVDYYHCDCDITQGVVVVLVVGSTPTNSFTVTSTHYL